MAEDDGVGLREAAPQAVSRPSAGPLSWTIAIRTPSTCTIRVERQPRLQLGRVDIAANGVHGGPIASSSAEHRELDQIAGVQDGVGGAQQLQARAGTRGPPRGKCVSLITASRGTA